jgi:hypothetical protein
LASAILSPLDFRTKEKGALGWSLKNDNILAVNSLLKDPRVDPSTYNNYAIRKACEKGYKEVVETLLQGTFGNCMEIPMATL